MTWLGLLLLGVAVCDLVHTRRGPRGLPDVVGVVAVVAVGVASGLTAGAEIAGVVVVAGAVVAWGRTVTWGFGHDRAGVPLVVLAVAVVGALAASAAGTEVGGVLGAWWSGLTWPVATAVDPTRALLVLAAGLVQLSTGNVLVRLVLQASGTARERVADANVQAEVEARAEAEAGAASEPSVPVGRPTSPHDAGRTGPVAASGSAGPVAAPARVDPGRTQEPGVVRQRAASVDAAEPSAADVEVAQPSAADVEAAGTGEVEAGAGAVSPARAGATRVRATAAVAPADEAAEPRATEASAEESAAAGSGVVEAPDTVEPHDALEVADAGSAGGDQVGRDPLPAAPVLTEGPADDGRGRSDAAEAVSNDAAPGGLAAGAVATDRGTGGPDAVERAPTDSAVPPPVAADAAAAAPAATAPVAGAPGAGGAATEPAHAPAAAPSAPAPVAPEPAPAPVVTEPVAAPAAADDFALKGGRLLGPMERLLIFGLGLTGNLVAASIVVAAKGLLRFPELQSRREQEQIHRLTEYFLVGSFISWLVALGAVALLAG